MSWVTGVFEVDLPRDVSAPGTARSLIAGRFATVLGRGDLQDATLLTTELVTNAIRHGSGRIVLRADRDHKRLRVEVIDEGDGFEHASRERDFHDVEGSGLKLVDAIASRWGIHEGTTHVWFELEPAGPRLGAEDDSVSRER